MEMMGQYGKCCAIAQRKKDNGEFVYSIEMYENKKIEPSSPRDSLGSGRNRVPNSSNEIIQDGNRIVKERYSVDDGEQDYDALDAEFAAKQREANEAFLRERLGDKGYEQYLQDRNLYDR